jgi:hypothetical protein
MWMNWTPGIAIFVVAAGLVAYAQAASAKDVQIGGTHSSSEIKGACAKVGGNFYQNSAEDGGGYGCYNENGNGGNGTAVDCDNTGHCIGTERPGVKVKSAAGATVVIDVLK